MLCDISANAHDIIHEIVEEYFKNEWRNMETYTNMIKIKNYLISFMI
jgi:hypothetical protein